MLEVQAAAAANGRHLRRPQAKCMWVCARPHRVAGAAHIVYRTHHFFRVYAASYHCIRPRRHSHVVRCEVATWRAGVCGLCVRGAVHVHAAIGVFVSVRGLTSATTFDLWASEKVACPRYSKWRRRHSQARRRFERMHVRTPARLQPPLSIVRNQVRALSAAPALSELLSSEERYVVASDSECACASTTNVLRRKNAVSPSLRRANCAWFITRL